MDRTDRQAITGLFDRLAEAEHRAPARDAEAERFIAEAVARQPAAPYYLAQTVIVQQHALNAAEDRIAALEADLADARGAGQGGGFLSGLFGSGASAPRRRAAPVAPMPQGAPGGFLAGAAQTAMGVAGGMLIASAIGGMIAGDAAAAEPEAEADAGDFGEDEGW